MPQLQGNNVWRGPEACISPEVACQFKDAITDYNRVNLKRWSLQRQFQIDKPYEIVSPDTVGVLFKQGLWKAFEERYPGLGGILPMSSVGFNKEKPASSFISVVLAVLCAARGASACWRKSTESGGK